MQNANKAWIAAVITGLSAFIAQVQGKEAFTDLSALQWVVVVLSAVVAAFGVYVVPNRPTKP